ncbi:CAAX prenyl protease-related protein [archaeon]|jgi:uncharacterized protein|nr:CAAX prenyl protease-related protein [archaeon]MBT4350973.1 CAAX prenyl protease-related protein [archaeon]MBT4647664.1 CAAX prenyl protease-related protein [archaeon]MBT6822221.1 CAAX prenyl protease-related protein [archaeon]MBT7391484.1 CAAX prenyl protease-related protein [archaeon]
MLEYIIPFFTYLFSPILIELFTKNVTYSDLGKVILTGMLLAFYWKKYKIKWKISFLAFFVGALIFGFWVFLEGYYPIIGTPKGFEPLNSFELIIRLFSSILIAPLIEELFIRSFFNRYLISQNWKKLPIESTTTYSFWITVLFFGFSHNRWLPGLIAGILLNLVLIKKKDISQAIFAHFIANLFLSIYVIATKSWIFW